MVITKTDEVVIECFCTKNNGGFEDILNEFEGFRASRKYRSELADRLEEELLDFSSGYKVKFDSYMARMFAEAEVAYRIDYETDTFKVDSFMDDVRWNIITSDVEAE